MSFLKMQLKLIGAELVGALVDAGFEKAGELATNARERRDRDAEEHPKGCPPPVDSSDPLRGGVEPWGMSRHPCLVCGCAVFFRRSEGVIVFQCSGAAPHVSRLSLQEAANREGVSL